MKEQVRKLTVGQTVYVFPHFMNGAHAERKVLKVGRVWAKLDNGYRIELARMVTEDGTAVYASLEQKAEEDHLRQAWREFKRDIDRFYSAPVGMTIDKINAARKTLELPL
jgi:hypothetical protein